MIRTNRQAIRARLEVLDASSRERYHGRPYSFTQAGQSVGITRQAAHRLLVAHANITLDGLGLVLRMLNPSWSAAAGIPKMTAGELLTETEGNGKK